MVGRIKIKSKAILAYSIFPTMIILFVILGFLHTTILSLIFLIFLGELAISAWLMIRLVYNDNRTITTKDIKIQNRINFEQANEFILTNNDISCN